MGMGLHLNLEQRMQLQMKLGLGVFAPDGLDGSPESLEELLANQPQESNEGLNYLVSGGWAVELLSKQPREHHDLDVVKLSRVPINFELDIQSPRSYFGALSMTSEEIADKYVAQADWQGPSGKKFEVYTTTPEFIFLSKLIGFMREPRDKDYQDLESLAKLITPGKNSVEIFKDLLTHVPGMHSHFHKNKQLMTDLNENQPEDQTTMGLTGSYIVEIIDNFRKGNLDFARKQSARVHDALKKVYEDGLKNSISLRSSKIAQDKLENAWRSKQLSGFWVKDGESIDLRIPQTKDNMKYVNYLQMWQSAEDSTGSRFKSLEKIADDVYLADAVDGFRLVMPEQPVSKAYKKFSKLEDILMLGVYESPIADFGIDRGTDVFDSNGKLILSTSVSPAEFYSEGLTSPGAVRLLNKEMLKSGDYSSSMKLMEHIANMYSKGGENKGQWQILGNRANSAIFDAYEELVGEEKFDSAKSLAKAVSFETKTIDERVYSKALQDQDTVKLSRLAKGLDLDADELNNKYLAVGVYSFYPNGNKKIKPSDVKHYAEVYAQTPNPSSGAQKARDQLYAILLENEHTFALAEKFAGKTGIGKEQQELMQNRYLGKLVNNWISSRLEEPDRKSWRFINHFNLQLEKPILDRLRSNIWTERLYLRQFPEPERAMKLYKTLISSGSTETAKKIAEQFNFPSDTTYRLFCEDPFMFREMCALRALDIPVDEKSKEAATKLLARRLVGRHGANNAQASYLVDKFQIPYETVKRIVFEDFDRLISKGYSDIAAKKVYRLCHEGRLMSPEDMNRYLDKKAQESPEAETMVTYVRNSVRRYIDRYSRH